MQLHNAVWVYRDGIVHLGMRHIFAKTVGLICKLDFAVCFKLHNIVGVCWDGLKIQCLIKKMLLS